MTFLGIGKVLEPISCHLISILATEWCTKYIVQLHRMITVVRAEQILIHIPLVTGDESRKLYCRGDHVHVRQDLATV